MSQAFLGSGYIQQMVMGEISEFDNRYRGQVVPAIDLEQRALKSLDLLPGQKLGFRLQVANAFRDAGSSREQYGSAVVSHHAEGGGGTHRTDHLALPKLHTLGEAQQETRQVGAELVAGGDGFQCLNLHLAVLGHPAGQFAHPGRIGVAAV